MSMTVFALVDPRTNVDKFGRGVSPSGFASRYPSLPSG